MKRILTSLLLLASLSASAQWVGVSNTLQRQSTAKGFFYRFSLGAPGFMQFYTQPQVDSLLSVTVGASGTVKSITPGIGFTSNTPITTTGTLNVDTVNTIATKYYASVASPKIPGDRPISSVPAIGDNPGTNLTAAAWIIAGYYKSQPPTMSLSGGTSRERLPAGSDVIAVGWTAGRPASGAPITTIVVNGVNQSFASPAAGASVSGTQNVTVTRNTNITISGTASTAEPKSGSGSTTFSFYDKRYAGFDANALVSGKPAQADILAASFQDNNGTTAALTQTTAQQGSNKYYFYITTATISSVTINGIPSTASFNINIPITFTNAVGGTFSGYANVSVNQFGANAGGNTIVFN